MKAPRNLTEMWSQALGQYVEKHKIETGPEYFDKVLMNAVATVAKRVSSDEKLRNLEEQSLADVVAKLRSTWPDGFANESAIGSVRHAYLVVHGDRMRLRDLRAQYDWASSWDHAKFILFRTLTTLMIAGVILGTGYLAHRWGIPLPLIRGIQ